VSEITPAAPADADALGALFTAARNAAMPWQADLHTAAEDRRFIGERVMPRCEVLVARRDGEVAGFLALGDDMVEHLYVRPDAQRTGIGSALLAAAKARRPAGLRLWVFQRNEGARAFYAGHGFTELQRTVGAENEEREPDVLLGWAGERP